MDLDKCSEVCNISTDEERLECVENFTFLDVSIKEDGKTSLEINRKLMIATTKLKKIFKIWKSENIKLKLKIVKACIFPVALYGCESWTISKKD